jgi:ribose transport system ATP-binding protein
MDDALVQIRDVKKRFGSGTVALNGVSFDIRAGEVLALIGENGAGKSTLAKILAGVIPRDSGSIVFEGHELHFHSMREARAAGISIVLQEFNLIPDLSVAENVFLTAKETYRGGAWFDRKGIVKRTEALLEKANIDIAIDPSRRVSGLSIAEQQLVEVIKALSIHSSLLIFDEPTATLTKQETAKLFALIRKLKADGITIIFVSHRLEEIFEISDRIVVFRDGEKVREFDTVGTRTQDLIKAMVGRDIGDLYSIRKRNPPGETVVEIESLSRGNRVLDCSFRVRRGEVVGIAGLVGAGRTELIRAIFGADHADSGRIVVQGHEGRVRSPRHAIRMGMGMVPEDRKQHGILVSLPIYQNLTLSYHVRSRGFWINRKKENILVEKEIAGLRIKMASNSGSANSLSGGNQQKVVLAKWLLTDPQILFLDEPTRGIDIGAKFDVYNLIDALARRGVAIVLVSSELSEIIALSDRVLVMRSGKIVKELDQSEVSEEVIMSYCTEGEYDDGR